MIVYMGFEYTLYMPASKALAKYCGSTWPVIATMSGIASGGTFSDLNRLIALRVNS